MKKYNSLPKSWVKILLDSVFKNKNTGNEYIKNSFQKTSCYVEVTLPDGGVWVLENAHNKSIYFRSKVNNKKIRVSNHWRTCSTRNVSHYIGCSCIPVIRGKVETYRGFAAMLFYMVIFAFLRLSRWTCNVIR